MPWLETSPMDQRKQFIADFHRGLQSATGLAVHSEQTVPAHRTTAVTRSCILTAPAPDTNESS